jgi:hypothetical protein
MRTGSASFSSTPVRRVQDRTGGPPTSRSRYSPSAVPNGVLMCRPYSPECVEGAFGEVRIQYSAWIDC